MNLWYELNYTLRTIRKKIGFSTLCVVVIALGYAITIPLYSLVNNFAYATLPFPDQDRIAFVSQIDSRTNSGFYSASFDQFQLNVIRQNVTTFDEVGAYHTINTTLSDGEFAQDFQGYRVTANALSITAAQPILGRTFQSADETPDAPPVLLISNALWQNYYAADLDIIGRISRVNGEAHTIVGVMPEGYRYPQTAELWLPLTVQSAADIGEGNTVAIIGKLREGVDRVEASSELDTIVSRLSSDYPDAYPNRSAEAVTLVYEYSGGLILWNSIAGLAMCIYFLVSLNVGNLLMIRANERIGELAIRSALGAARANLIAHVLLESLLICLLGSCVGLVAAGLTLDLLQTTLFGLMDGGRSSSFWFDFSFNSNVAYVAIAMLFLLWFLSGGLAAWRASKKDVAVVLGGGSKGVSSLGNGRVTRTLVLAQVILSFFLLVLSGSYVSSINQQYERPVVSTPESYISVAINLGAEAYTESSQKNLFLTNFRQQLSEQADIESITFGSTRPGRSSYSRRLSLENAADSEPIQAAGFSAGWIDKDYFQSTGFNLLQGRFFDSGDSADSEGVVIVDSIFVQRMGLTDSPIGKQIRLSNFLGVFPDQLAETNSENLLRIVGVVPYLDQSQAGLTPKIYLPLTQGAPDTIFLIARIDPRNTLTMSDWEQRIKAAARAADQDVSLSSFETLSAAMELQNFSARMFGSIFGGSAIATLVLATVGLYGLISRAVFTRGNEIGIRRAIGSSNALIVRLFLRQGVIYLISAAVFGGGVAVLIANVIVSLGDDFNLLSGLSTVFILVTALVGGLICCASYIPVRKVIAMEPGEALHYE